MQRNIINQKAIFGSFRLVGRNNSGIILLVVLWILAILSILAIGLGRRTSIDVALTRHAVAQLQADAAAWAAVIYAIDQIKRDKLHEDYAKFDTAYTCGFALKEDQTPEDLFKDISLGEDSFDIDFIYVDESDSANKEKMYGFQDEESKININALSQQNYKVLVHLIMLLGYSEEDGLTISSSIIDWHDADSHVTNSQYGAEDDYYSDLKNPYHCKNAAFDSLQELFLVRGMNKEIFEKMKGFITVFPKDATKLTVNLNTASSAVIHALCRAVSGDQTNTTVADADSLAEKIISYRIGDDARWITGDDRKVEMNDLGLNAKERSLFLSSRQGMTDISKFLRIRAEGTDASSQFVSRVNAIINRDTLSIVFWRKDRP